jgi:sulfur carrier protein
MKTPLPRPAVVLNDQPHELDGPSTLGALLAGQGLGERRGIAAAVNGTVVPRSGWDSTRLADGDRVLVIRATQGG